jgi:hypothetical protein
MEIAIALAIGGGLAFRLWHQRWWIWVISIAGLAMAVSWLAVGQQYLWKNSLLIAAVCAGIGAVLPDLGVGLRNYLRRPRTISIIVTFLVVSSLIWLATTTSLPPGVAEQTGRTIGSIIVGAIAVYGLWLIISGPFRRRRRR